MKRTNEGFALLVTFVVSCVSSAPGQTQQDPTSTDPSSDPSSGTGDGTGSGSGSGTGSGSGSGSSGTSTAQHVYGVTVDDISRLSTIVTSLQGLPHRATARIVFDEGQPATYYAQAVPQIGTVADVMGEILDSEYVPNVSVSAYLARTTEYLNAFGSNVNLWEVGNEINGNWVDTTSGGVSDVVAKMTGAYDLVKAAGGKTELTLYGCSDAGQAHDMLVWANANVPTRMKTGLDYVLVSFYEGDCGVAAPDWPTVFHQLHLMFPSSAIGFGEVGAVDSNGNRITNTTTASAYLERYYTMPITEPGYVGGHFWWYYVEDMLPLPSTMYNALATVLQ